MHLYPINGAAHRVGQGRHRLELPRRATSPRSSWASIPIRRTTPASCSGPRTTGSRCTRFSAGGGYVNMMMDEGEDNVKAAYRDNYARLPQIKKRKYDPGNLFRVNQNIKPA